MDITLERILQLIKDNGITQKQFGVEIGIGVNGVTFWKKGQTTSYKKYVDKIANYFGVDVNYLLGNTDIKKQAHQINGEPVLFVPETETDRQFLNLISQLDEENKQRLLDYIEFLADRQNK